MVKALKFLAHLFGFEKINKQEREYLHDANLKTSGYMSFIVIVIEVWMIIRQFIKNIIPALNDGSPFIKTVFSMTSLYFLFIVISLGVMLFCIFYNRNKRLTTAKFILLLVSGSLCVIWSFLLPFEKFSASSNATRAFILNFFLSALYVMTFLVGAFVILYAIVKYKKNINLPIVENIIIILFSFICLAFGMRVGYSDFTSSQPKEIICFLTMIIYVGCLLIFRPYITLIMLGVAFYAFYKILSTYNGGESFLDGDKINYLTFVISLITICFSMYQGRLSEARNAISIENLAKYDKLTGLYNYNYFTDRVSEKINNLKGDKSKYVFIYIDIYNFNAYNEKKGFEAGDNFLIEMANNIKELFKGSLYARQADDHFVVFTNDDNYENKIEELSHIVQSKETEILLTINCGITRINDVYDDPRHSIDRARYAARLIKHNIDKHYIEYDNKMEDAYHKRLYVINNIEKAVEEGMIVPYYQPVVWSDDNKLCGCEALCRWINDPVYGQLYPNEFVPVLEEFRLIHKLDACIIKKVCEDLHNAIENKVPVIPVSVNFSRLDFELMDAVNILENEMAKYNIPRHLVHVEITESALVDSYDVLKDAMNQFKKLGYSLWLDDFGSGYSSLNVLKDYEFDVLKIDMKFLSNFSTNKKAGILIDNIIKMADSLGMLTLTEGVETSEEAEFLKKVGCGRLQGYLFGKPIPRDTLYKRIENKELIVSDIVL